uniref:NADH dehydrogenase [ubiquinone] flavoprotein 3, mitochondrial n=1 Tax=Acrobeloides nanus TaxID=290746 RepID=A0A914EAD8_9BILA
MLSAKKFISKISGNVVRTFMKSEAPIMASTSSTNALENRMFFRASSPQHMDKSNTGHFMKIQQGRFYHTASSAEQSYDHHFVEDSYFMERDGYGCFDKELFKSASK